MMKAQSSLIHNCILATLLSSAMIGATPVYQVERAFGKEQMTSPPTSITVDAKDQVLVLLANGTVLTYDVAGKPAGSFKAEMKPSPTAMAVADGKVYLLSSETKAVTRGFQGPKVARGGPVGVKCAVFTGAGAKQSEFALPGVVSAADAHFIGGQLAVGDLRKSQIVFYQLSGTEAKETRKIDKVFRLCCGIFDFCPTADGKSLLAANLGAFKVQTFTDGVKAAEFGARGEKLEEFTGCCNPVNVAALADGSLVTVEKSPTRVKVYDKDGKDPKVVEGLGELVEGCSTIPVAVDSKGALFLASRTKSCVVKCVAGTVPAAP